MRASRVVVLAQVVAAITVLVYASMLPTPPGAGVLLAWETAAVAAAIGSALLVLGFFNVWLPRGDAVDTTVAVAFAAGLLLGHPLLASGVVVLARCATVAIKPRGHTLESVVEQTARRTLLIACAYAAAYWFAPSVLFHLDPRLTWPELAFVAISAIVFIIVDALIEQTHASLAAGIPFVSLLSGLLRLQGWMLAAEMSTAVLAVVMFPALRYWGLLVTVALLLVMRQSFALLLEVRASYTATVEVLARSLDAYDPGRRGHGERVAGMVAHAGRLVGFQGRALENMTYAALFHDVGRLGADEADEAPTMESAHVLSGVGFLSGAIPILQVLDSAGDVETSLDEEALIGAYLIAAFSALDSDINTGGREGRELARSIGTRLYSATRKNVDRVIQRVEQDMSEGNPRLAQLADVVQ